MENAESLRRKIRETEQELARLKEELREVETVDKRNGHSRESADKPSDGTSWKWPLPPEDYERYARQLIIPQVGVQGELPPASHGVSILTQYKASCASRGHPSSS